MMATKKKRPVTQQEFLRDAMSALNMTRDRFAERIGAKRKTLDNWLLPESDSSRGMPDMAWKFIRQCCHKIRKIIDN